MSHAPAVVRRAILPLLLAGLPACSEDAPAGPPSHSASTPAHSAMAAATSALDSQWHPYDAAGVISLLMPGMPRSRATDTGTQIDAATVGAAPIHVQVTVQPQSPPRELTPELEAKGFDLLRSKAKGAAAGSLVERPFPVAGGLAREYRADAVQESGARISTRTVYVLLPAHNVIVALSARKGDLSDSVASEVLGSITVTASHKGGG